MTIIEAINRIDSLKPNNYTQEEKVEWLSTLDGVIKTNIIDTHEGADKEQAIVDYIKNNVLKYKESVAEYMKCEGVSEKEAKEHIEFREIKYKEAKEHIEKTRNDIMFNGYDENTSLDTVLIIPAPYDDIYIRWLETQIDYANADYGKYSNSMTMYNTAYEEFVRWYNRNHMPLGKSIKFF